MTKSKSVDESVDAVEDADRGQRGNKEGARGAHKVLEGGGHRRRAVGRVCVCPSSRLTRDFRNK